MATRSARAPENQLVEQVLRLRSDVDGLKAAQIVGGANVLGYVAAAAGTYDISYSVPASSKLSKKISLVPNNAVYAPFAQLYLYYAASAAVLANAIPPYANGPTVSMAVQDLTLNGQTNQWYATFTNNTTSAQTIYLKCVFNTSSLGNLVITSLP